MHFERIFRASEIILTEGAFVERLKAEFGQTMDLHINHAGFIYEQPELLKTLYKQYIDVGLKHQLPIMLTTPTRKVNIETLSLSAYKHKDILSDACSFLNNIKDSYTDYSKQILLGGLLGCKGDAYSGHNLLGVEEAYQFHRQTTIQFQKEKLDFLLAGIMPEINEALGMAKAMADTQLPYIISFMIRKDGCLLDGTKLSDAIEIIDYNVNSRPICYMTNCVHPRNLLEALEHNSSKRHLLTTRFKGIQANASSLSPEELNNCSVLQQDDFKVLIADLLTLYKQHHLKIFGGCCGTNEAFIDDLAATLQSSAQHQKS